MNKIESAYKKMMEDWEMSGEMIGCCMKDKALEIERELTAARQEIDMLKSKYADHHAEAERLTSEINAVTEQRDRLAVALKELLTTGDNGYGTPTDKAWEMAEQALAAVKGGCDDPVNLIHNGVGIADMYQPGELEKELRSMTGAEPQNA